MQIASFNTIFLALYILVAASLVCGQADVKPAATPDAAAPDASSKTPTAKPEDYKKASGILNSVSTGLGSGGLTLPSSILKSIADGVGKLGADKSRRSIKVERDY